MSCESNGEGPPASICRRPFYRIVRAGDGVYDVWLSPGEAVPMTTEGGITDYNLRLMAVTGVEWPGSEQALEEDIRRRYADWVASAEIIEI